MTYWLLKTEPTTFSIDDLSSAPHQTTFWDGVRNYQARNMLRDAMKVGELAFFYHSNCKQPGIVGIVKITQVGQPDSTAFDPKSPYYDPRSKIEHPTWYGVSVKLVKKFPAIVSLDTLRHDPKLKDMIILRKGNRLSITPISDKQWQTITNVYKFVPQ